MKNIITIILTILVLKLHSQINMEINFSIDSDCFIGDTVQVDLTTRLLINEELYKIEGRQGEAHDLEISINGGDFVSPFTDPSFTLFTDQGGIDDGRLTNNVLDECEPVNSGDFPDWTNTIELVVDSNPFIISAQDKAHIFDGFPGSMTDLGVLYSEIDYDTLVCQALAVEFESVSISNGVLQWSTSLEYNSSHFEIEKAYEGEAKIIGSVPSMNKSSHYQFIDQNQGEGANYYRVLEVDLNGNITSSDIVVEYGKELGIKDRMNILQQKIGYHQQGFYLFSGPIGPQAGDGTTYPTGCSGCGIGGGGGGTW